MNHQLFQFARFSSYLPDAALSYGNLDLRGQVPLTRHFYSFDILVPVSTESNLRNPNKGRLRADIFGLLEQGRSYRQISETLGIHWTRVGQIVQEKKRQE